ncbi:MAG TPA: aminodeoxychorismate lyase [Gammaproteobacteria bacterium]
MKILVNGVSGSHIDCTDRGLQYGDGLFETIACKSGKLLLWQAHMSRLQQGCERLNIPAATEDQWLEDIRKLTITAEHAVIKLIITRGTAGRGYKAPLNPEPTRIVAVYPWPEYSPEMFEKGIRVKTCKTQISVNPTLAGLKHLNRLDNVLARSEWNDKTIAEGLMLDDQGYVIEGTMSNLFAIKDKIAFTPKLHRCGINGVMRSAIVKIIQNSNILLKEQSITLNDLLEMDEVFVSNSIISIWPVAEIDRHSYSVGPITKSIMNNLDIQSDCYEL